VVYEVGKRSMTSIMERRPALADSLSQILAARKVKTESALNDVDQDEQEREIESFARKIALRMRDFLDLRRSA
jgi:hypothetical protein